MSKSSGDHRLGGAEIQRTRQRDLRQIKEQKRDIQELQGIVQQQGDEIALLRSEVEEVQEVAQPWDDDYGAFQEGMEGPEGTPGQHSSEGDDTLTLQMILAYPGNLVHLLDETTLSRIGESVEREYQLDEMSRKEWLTCAKEALKIATQKMPEKKMTPYAGASNIRFPLLTSACMQFNARAYPAIVRGDEVVDAKPLGRDDDGMKAKRAQRTSSFANDQLIYRCTEWQSGTDAMLIGLPAIGKAFRKVYWSAALNRPRLDYVSALDVCVAHTAPSLDLAPRITHILKKYPYEAEQLMRGDIWIEHDLRVATDDSQAPVDYLEQCRWEDLDEDGLSEPYIVTIHKETRKVVRIDPAFDVGDVKMSAPDEDDEEPRVLSINRQLHWVDYDFMPDPEGGFYAIGFGQLLSSLGAAIDTTINELLDAGHLANTLTGFMGAPVRTRSGDMELKPNTLKTLPGITGKITDSLHIIQFPGPNPALMNLLEFLIETAKDITSVKDVLTGDAPGTQPATSTLALIEQGLQVFSAIYKRYYRALTRETQLLYELNKRYLSVEDYNKFLDANPPQASINEANATGPQGVPPVANAPSPESGLAPSLQGSGEVIPFPNASPASMPGAGGAVAGGPTGAMPSGPQPPASLPPAPGSAGSPNGGVDMPMGPAPQMPPQGPSAPMGGPPPGLQAALAANMPQQPEVFDPVVDFNADDMDVRPVADPSAVTEMQRLGKANYLMQWKGDPGVDQNELNKRAWEAAQLPDIEKLIAPPNPLMEQQSQAQVQQVVGEARKVNAEAMLIEAQVPGAQIEPQIRMAEASRAQADAQAKQYDAQAKMADTQAKMAELEHRKAELALTARQHDREDMKLQLEMGRHALEERRHALEEHRTAIDEAERGSKLDLEHGKLEDARERTTLERIKVLGDQKLGREATIQQLRQIITEADNKRADREQKAKDAEADRALKRDEMKHDVKLREKDIEAKERVAKEGNKLKAEVAKVAARNKPKPAPK